MRVALCQLPSQVADLQANLATVVRTVQANDADLFVFPELFLTGYGAGPSHRDLALDPAGSTLESLVDLARRRRATIAVGATRHVPGRRPRDSLFLVGPDGHRTHYDKVHLADFLVFHERTHFDPGEVPVVAPGPGDVSLGLSLCYDHLFPELAKTEALAGAQVLLNPSASASLFRMELESLLRTRARETQSYVVYVNLVGDQGAFHFFGASMVVDPFGEVIHRSPEEETSVDVVDLDMDRVTEARQSRPTLRDTHACWRWPGRPVRARAADWRKRFPAGDGGPARPP